jgi:hypothetical protein
MGATLPELLPYLITAAPHRRRKSKLGQGPQIEGTAMAVTEQKLDCRLLIRLDTDVVLKLPKPPDDALAAVPVSAQTGPLERRQRYWDEWYDGVVHLIEFQREDMSFWFGRIDADGNFPVNSGEEFTIYLSDGRTGQAKEIVQNVYVNSEVQGMFIDFVGLGKLSAQHLT